MTIKDKKTNKLLLNAFDYDFDLWWKDVASGVYGVDVKDTYEGDLFYSIQQNLYLPKNQMSSYLTLSSQSHLPHRLLKPHLSTIDRNRNQKH